MKESVLSATNLTVGYTSGHQKNILFDSINLSLRKGELVCFMGPNGIGKSTLIRVLAGTQQPICGSVDGISNKKVAAVFTDRISPGMMTVKDLVSYGRYPYLNWSVRLTPTDSQIIKSAIKQVHIEKLVDAPLHELSDGQLQMAMIAKALAQDTPVLLLDEPTAHLDLNNRVEIMNLLRDVAKKRDKAILVSTHELDLALQTADRVWVATSNKSIREGIPEDLVLDGTFDAVFQFKGFDLKTGKVKQEPFRHMAVQLEGDGPIYLWTKNALERNGYHIRQKADLQISISNENALSWTLLNQQKKKTCSSLEELLRHLNSLHA